MKLTINLVTRGRPRLLLWTIDKTLGNLVRSDTTFMVSVDDDDEDTRRAVEHFKPDVRISVGPRDSYGSKYNRMLREAPADLYLGMVDYAPHVTQGFDDLLLEASQQFPDGIGVVYNRLENLSFPGINAVTQGLVTKMGYYYPEYFPFWFVDHWLDSIAKMIDRIGYSKVRMDMSRRPGTQGRRDISFWAEFFIRTAPLREKIAQRILLSEDFQCLDWERKLRIARFPLVRQHDTILNAILHRDFSQDAVEDTPYHSRLRDRAAEVLREVES